MQDMITEQPFLDFYMYPPVGADDWRYVIETAQIRVLEMQMLGRATLSDMANSESIEQAVDFIENQDTRFTIGVYFC